MRSLVYAVSAVRWISTIGFIARSKPIYLQKVIEARNHIQFSDDTLSPPPFPPRSSHLCYRSFVCVFIGWRSGGGEAMMEVVAAHWSSLNVIRPPPQQGPSRDPNALRLPDSMLRLVEPRLSLNLTACNPWSAWSSAMARHSVFSATRPMVVTCNATIAAMYRTKKYSEAIALFHFFFNKSNLSSF